MSQLIEAASTDGGYTYSVVFPDYNKSLIEELKNKLPQDKRAWVPEEKCWQVDGDYLESVIDMAKKYWPKAEVSITDVC